jgi:hypothetical protein
MFFGISPFASGPFSTTLETRLIAQSVPATSSAGSITVVGHANFSLTGSSNTISIGSVVVTAKSVTLSDSIPATASLGTTIVVANANVAPSGVDSQANLGTTTVLADANTSITSPALTSTVGTGSNIQAKAVVLPIGVASNVAIGIVNVSTQVILELVNVPLNIFSGSLTVTTTQFDYESLKSSFDRRRVVFIAPTNQGYTVNIPADPRNRTVLIEATNTDRVVRIAA